MRCSYCGICGGGILEPVSCPYDGNRVNEVFRDSGEPTFQSLTDCSADAGSVDGEIIGEQLVRRTRQISDVSNQLRTVDNEIESLKRFEDYLMNRRATESWSNGRGLTAEHPA